MTITTHEPLCVAAAGECICKGLGAALSGQYKKGWDDAARFAAEQATARLSKKARPTSREAVARNADSIKGVQRDVYDALSRAPLGLTDFDLEDALGRSHQSVSAARNALMMAGLVTDSGKTRPNARGNSSTVWVLSSPSSKDNDEAPADDRDARPCRHCGTTTCARRPGYPYCYGDRDGRLIGHTHTCNDVRPTSVKTCPACLAEAGQTGLWP